MSLVKADVDTRFAITKVIGPVVIADDGDTLSSAVDLTAYPGWKVLLIAAIGTRVDGTFTASVTEAATSGGEYSALTPVSGSVAAINASNTVRKATYLPSKPFIKVNIAAATTTDGAPVTAFVMLVPPTS
jgi:hypothetical protein